MPKEIVTIKFGSHLYGTSTPSSDIDLKSVQIPDAMDILLQRAKGGAPSVRTKALGEKNEAGELDVENFTLQRFLQLLSEGQTVAIDMLFAPEWAFVGAPSPLWYEIRENRDKLLCKRSTAFVGYCRQQANKYGVKGSRVAAAKKAMSFFESACLMSGTVAKVRDYEGLLYELVDENRDHMAFVDQTINKAGDVGRFYECCNRKVGFDITVKEARGIFTRIYENYGVRARLAESNKGVDWKALSHAVRVGQEALELLQTAHVTFPLVNAAHVLAIKRGEVPYQQVDDEIQELLAEVEQAAILSPLPERADTEWIDNFVVAVHLRQIQTPMDVVLHRG